ncbi:MAG: YdcF family protein [Patescibacteria group bacterium]
MKKSNYDAILIPLGGLEKNGTPHEWVRRRLDKAIEIQTGKEFIIPLGSGTPHKPVVLDKKGLQIKECVASADYLVKRGISKKRILVDKFSDDTIGNGYFSRFFFADPFNFKNILVINSDHHMSRTRAISEWVYSLTPQKNKYQLNFLSVSDIGIDPTIIKARSEKEKKSLKNILILREKIKTLESFHCWLFTEHAVYSYGLKVKEISPKVLKTY